MPKIKYKLEDGTSVKGATTIKGAQLGWGKQPLLYWANKQGLEGKTLNEARDTATVPGTIAHMLIENYLLDEIKSDITKFSDEDISKAQTSFQNFIKWTETFQFKKIDVEPHLVSEIFGYGGTPDVIGKVQDQTCIIDWKTGKVYEDLFLQLAAYKQLAEENGYGKIKGFHVLRIPRDEEIPSFHHSYWESMPDEAWLAFRCCIKLMKCEKTLKDLL